MLSQILLTAAAGHKGGGALSSLLMFGLIIIVFYFFMIRPQVKKSKDAKKFREGLKKGDKVVTIGGIYGKIADIKDTSLIIEIAENVRIKVEKSAVSAEYSGHLEQKGNS